MLLLIDPKKIEEALRKTPPSYVISPCNVEIAVPRYENPAVYVGSTVTTMSPELERSRERVLSLRQHLIDSGRQPLSPDALEREINETRGWL